MKTLKISDDVHQKLTALLGELTAQTMKMQTYQDAIAALGYTRKEEFIRQAIRFLLKWESEEYEYIEIPREKYERLNQAIKEMNTPFYSVDDFVNYDKWLEEKQE